jgi:hypothetical protein
MPTKNCSWRYPGAPADDAPRAEHEAYAKNPQAHGYTHWTGRDGKRYDLPAGFAFFWIPCSRCGKMIGGHEAHLRYIGPSTWTGPVYGSMFVCEPIE